MKRFACLPLLLSPLFLTPACAAENSVLRVACSDDSVGAEIHVNKVFKGECPLDITVAEGNIVLKAHRSDGTDSERVYERSFRIGGGVVKREEVQLGPSQLTPKAAQLRRERELAAEQEKQAQLAAQKMARDKREELIRTRLQKLQQGADAGDIASLLELANVQEMGELGPRNHVAAVENYRKAAERGDAFAMYRLAMKYRAGAGVAQNDASSLAWLSRASEAGSPVAMGELARAFEQKGDLPGAKELVQRAERAGGSKQALWIKAVFLRSGYWTGQKDEAAGYAVIEQLASDGFFRAKRAVALQHLSSGDKYTAAQKAVAMELLAAAASPQENGDRGDTPSMNFLGYIYRKGEYGIAKDWKKSESWYLAAANAGEATAYNSLGILYTEGGPGIPADMTKAVDAYTKGVNLGVVDCMVNMGRLYNFPWLSGWEQNYKAAAGWYRRAIAEAAARNNQEAKTWAENLLNNIPWLYR